MAAQIFDLVDDLSQTPPKRDAIEQGADFGWVLSFEAADTDGTEAGDWFARMQVRTALADRDTGDPLLDLDSDELGGIAISIVTGTTYDAVQLDITAAAGQTQALPAGKWYYDVELVRSSDDYTRRIAKGRAQVTGEVTREAVA